MNITLKEKIANRKLEFEGMALVGKIYKNFNRQFIKTSSHNHNSSEVIRYKYINGRVDEKNTEIIICLFGRYIQINFESIYDDKIMITFSKKLCSLDEIHEMVLDFIYIRNTSIKRMREKIHNYGIEKICNAKINGSYVNMGF